ETFGPTTRLRTASESAAFDCVGSTDRRSRVWFCAATIVGMISSRAIVSRTLIALSFFGLSPVVRRALALAPILACARMDIRPPTLQETVKDRNFQKNGEFWWKMREISLALAGPAATSSAALGVRRRGGCLLFPLRKPGERHRRGSLRRTGRLASESSASSHRGQLRFRCSRGTSKRYRSARRRTYQSKPARRGLARRGRWPARVLRGRRRFRRASRLKHPSRAAGGPRSSRRPR